MQAIEFIHPQERDRLAECHCPALVGTRLDQVAVELRGADTVEAVFDELVEHLQEDLPFDRLGLALLGPDGSEVVSRRVHSSQPLLIWGPGQSASLVGSSLEPLLREGALRIIHDLRRYLQLRPSSASTRALIREGMRSSLTIPLYDGAEPLGFLFFTSCRSAAYTPQHVAIAAMLAPIVGRAVGRAVAKERARPPRAPAVLAGPVAGASDQRLAPC